MKLSRTMAGVRPFVHDDIPSVAALHWRVFEGSPLPSRFESDYCAYFKDVYLDGPGREQTVESLVSEESGKITGFLGVVPRHMTWQGSPVLAAVATNFAVSPESRGLAGVKLLGAFLAGGQDFSIADRAVSVSRKAWEGLGGRTSLFHSVRWLCVLSPARAALDMLGRRRGLLMASRVLSPAGRAMDALVSRIPKGPFQRIKSQLSAKPLDPSVILSHADELLKTFPLRTAYDEISLAWMLRRAEGMKSKGPLQKVLLSEPHGKIVGWYLYYAKSGGIGEVLQIAAQE
ncbi:MAG: GNAT family N-acetyltransferase, partial [Terriglobia bacterium]